VGSLVSGDHMCVEFVYMGVTQPLAVATRGEGRDGVIELRSQIPPPKCETVAMHGGVVRKCVSKC
jgi:hypothetical protein